MFLKLPTTQGNIIINMNFIWAIIPWDKNNTKMWTQDDVICYIVELPFETVEAIVTNKQIELYNFILDKNK